MGSQSILARSLVISLERLPSMAAVTSAPLNAEPANPVERKNHNLPQKSYADAVEEDAHISEENGTNGTKEVNGTNGTNIQNRVNGTSNGAHTASVLRIMDTGAPEPTKKEEKPEENQNPGSEDVTEEYSATVSCIWFRRIRQSLTAQGTR